MSEDKTLAVFQKILTNPTLLERFLQTAKDVGVQFAAPSKAGGDLGLDSAFAAVQEAGYELLRNVDKTGIILPKGEAVGRIVVLDTETTSLDKTTGKIIQLSMMSVEHDGHQLVNAENIAYYDQYNDPGEPIPEEITKITGITDDMVRGQKINESDVARFIEGVDMAVAHNSKFDRGYLEYHLPDAGFQKLAFSCTMDDVDWPAHGVIGARNLSLIAQAKGITFAAHSAISDIKGLTQVIADSKHVETGAPLLKCLMDATKKVHYTLLMLNTDFRRKDIVKEVQGAMFNGEEDQLHINQKSWVVPLTRENLAQVADVCQRVYFNERRPDAPPPKLSVLVMDATERFSGRPAKRILNIFDARDPEASFATIEKQGEEIRDYARQRAAQADLFGNTPKGPEDDEISFV